MVREAAEMQQFSVTSWPDLPEKAVWETAYFEPYPASITGTTTKAKKALELLSCFGVQAQLPSRTNLLTQKDNTSCGFWVLHYIEEQVRCFLGERRGTMAPNFELRKSRVNAFLDKLAAKSGHSVPG